MVYQTSLREKLLLGLLCNTALKEAINRFMDDLLRFQE